eukprot:7496811-Alexandrium_andersonii.AAC.1
MSASLVGSEMCIRDRLVDTLNSHCDYVRSWYPKRSCACACVWVCVYLCARACAGACACACACVSV